MKLSVIIVNFNGKRFLDACLESLATHLSGIEHEIVMLDNASSDGSGVYIREKFPQVKLIESLDNLGFGAGNNEAVKHAAGKWLLLINNDTIVLDHLNPAIDYMERHPEVGLLGINMLDGNKKYLRAAGHFPNPGNMIKLDKLYLNGDFTTGEFSLPSYEVDWLAGSFLLISKENYLKIGGFDADYFMYVEDVDFCQKIAKRGLKRVFFPQLRYLHFVGFNPARNPMLVKGFRIYLDKHAQGLQKRLSLLALGINAIVKKIRRNGSR